MQGGDTTMMLIFIDGSNLKSFEDFFRSRVSFKTRCRGDAIVVIKAEIARKIGEPQ